MVSELPTSSTQDDLPENPPCSRCNPFSHDPNVFIIPPKDRNPQVLQRWRRATLVLNAARRFRYVEDLKHRRRLRTSLHVLVAAGRLQNFVTPRTTVSPEELAYLLQKRNPYSLQTFGGIDGLAGLLGTSLHEGLTDDPVQIQKQQEKFGKNTYPRQPAKGLFSFFIDAFKDPTLVILMVCAGLALASGIKSHGIKEGWYDGASIAFAVILVVLVTAVSDYRQSLQFMSLNEKKKNILVNVVRGGRRIKVSIFELVVGDIVLLSIGDQVPADGIFVEGHSLSLDESSMTGESKPVHVNHKMPFLLSGCKVSEGYGKMLVTGVGMWTEWGQLMAHLGDELGEETPLQVRLNGVATFVGQLGLAVAVLVFVILFIFYFVGHKEGANNSGKFKAGHTPTTTVLSSVVDIFAIAVTIVVVAVPEGLPLAVTLSLAFAMKKMMVDKALVRRLSACETMGSSTAVCTDKTGTLTLNQMTVVRTWVAGEFRDVEGNGLSNDVRSLLLEGIAQNCTAEINAPIEGKELEVIGSPTEKAVLIWGLKLGLNLGFIKSLSEVLQVETFNSTKKKAGVAVRDAVSGCVRVHWKGAPEIILEKSDMVLCPDNSKEPLTASRRQELSNAIDGMGAHSLRCVAFGYLDLEDSNVPTDEEQIDEWILPDGPLTLIAIVGMKDPCRPGVPEAVRKCQAAGVVVRMITGDNLATAKAIAAECNILQYGIALEGETFRGYTDEMRKQEVPKITVMARSSPSDKLLMVRTLRELGEVVAVTGDGTNDAPALREADIGLSMGIQGTEVAKESSDIIILDDDFASVVKMVRWGRSIYRNIQKFIQFQLTVNVAALTINFIAAVSVGDVPLTAVQLLWVNLIMDTLGALALATEPPTDDLLLRPPVGRKEPLISNVMIRNILVQAFYQVIVLLILQFRGTQILKVKEPRVNTTIIFNAFVLCQLFNEVNARKPEEWNIFKGLFTNKLFVGILCGTLLLQVIIVEFLNKFASTVTLTWQQWFICAAIGFLSWPISLVGKLIPVPKRPLWGSCERRRDHSIAEIGAP
ncbi:hypothetical protein GOP47_0021312 [Adiantum capillus-veneris]|uniref:Calcium-transporting ATPase n=1 Tax=Adiantum capillus-veneris TaxID=13818 RepID=A0A9D4Z8J0_ADICA|nr:hypothetical protein GOP47_0021312 [Adiantum capillus-veneris]